MKKRSGYQYIVGYNFTNKKITTILANGTGSIYVFRDGQMMQYPLGTLRAKVCATAKALTRSVLELAMLR